MNLTVNGETRSFESVATLTDLLAALGLDARAVVVEHNRAIVRRPALAETSINDGDSIEIVHFVGGG
ncbi:MAG: sulfur carrier protein ThiS [Gemmatimonadales bacterium]